MQWSPVFMDVRLNGLLEFQMEVDEPRGWTRDPAVREGGVLRGATPERWRRSRREFAVASLGARVRVSLL